MPNQSPPLDARERLLDKAREIIREKGPHRLVARKVYQSAGLTQGSFTWAFPKGIEQVLEEIFLHAHASLWDACLGLLTGSAPIGTPESVIKKAIQVLADAVREDQGRAFLYFQLEGLMSSPTSPTNIRQRLNDDRKAVANWAAGCQIKDVESLFDVIFGPVLGAGRAWAFGLSAVPPTALLVSPHVSFSKLAGRGRQQVPSQPSSDDLFGAAD